MRKTSALKKVFRNKISGLEIEQNVWRYKVQIPWPLENGFTRTSASNICVLFFGDGTSSKISKFIK